MPRSARSAVRVTDQEKRDLLGPSVGRRIREIRQRQGMSLTDLGGEDLSRSFLSLVESGKSRISLRALAIVAERLDTPIARFLEDEDSQRAIELGLDYAEIALERGKARECLEALEANQLAYKNEPRAQWLKGRALLTLDELTEGTKILRGAAELARGAEDELMFGEVCYSLGRSLYLSNHYEEAGVWFRQGLEALLSHDMNPALQARLNMAVGHILYVQNQIEEAISYYDRARELFGSLYDLGNVGSVFSAMSLAARKKGDLGAALRYSKQSVAAFRLKRDWKLVASELNNMAMRYFESGDLDMAIERGEEAVRAAEEAGAQDLEATSRATIAAVYLQQGRIEDAYREAGRAEALATDESPLGRIDAWIVLGQIAAGRNDFDEADSFYKKALEGLRQIGHRARFADTALSYSRVLKERGDIEAALEMAMEAASYTGGGS